MTLTHRNRQIIMVFISSFLVLGISLLKELGGLVLSVLFMFIFTGILGLWERRLSAAIPWLFAEHYTILGKSAIIFSILRLGLVPVFFYYGTSLISIWILLIVSCAGVSVGTYQKVKRRLESQQLESNKLNIKPHIAQAIVYLILIIGSGYFVFTY